MKKIIYIILSIILTSVTVFCFVTCSENGNDSGNNNSSLIDKPENDPSTIKANYTYRPDIADSNINLVSDGKSNYVIVYPAEQDDMIYLGVKELKLFFEEATGWELDSYKDAEYTAQSISKPFISIGKTSLYNAVGLSFDRTELGASGYEIKLIGDNVYIAGGYYGNLYGVYEFLYYQFGFEQYAPDEIHLDKKQSVKLKAFNLKDIPDMEFRVGCNGENSGSAGVDVMNRYRTHSLTNVFAGSWADDDIEPFHNYLDYITVGEYQEEHPDWFSPSGTQLCLTRDPDGLMDALVPKMCALLEKYPNNDIITFTQEDGPTWCTCEKCRFTGQASGESGDAFSFDASTAEREYYSAQNIRFMNELAKRILEEYTVENGYEHARYVYVYLFNYGMTSACPVKYDSNGSPVLDKNGNYQIFDDTLDISENLGVLYCYSFHTSYDVNGEYDKTTLTTIDKIKRWLTISDHFAFWAYSTHFTNYFVPYDSVQQLQDTCKFVKENKGQMYYNMAQHDMRTPVDWGRLESYLEAKLSWNSNADLGMLINDFFDNYFKDAASVMKELYYAYKSKMAYLADVKKVGAIINTPTSVLKKENWSFNELQGYLSYIDRAFEKIDYLKNTDSELYDKLYERINIESMTFKYMLYKLYPDKFGYDILQSLQSEMISQCREYGITKSQEGYDIGSLFD